jgi:hypothetical protein
MTTTLQSVNLRLPLPQAGIAVLRAHGSFRTTAARDHLAGEVLLRLVGVVFPLPTQHSVQVGRNQHIDVPPGTPWVAQLDCYPFRFLNHSCDPNAMFRGRELVAIRRVPRGDEITFDYNTTEWELATPFPCDCGALRCVGTVRGYRHLSTAEQQPRRAFAAAHVLQEEAGRRESAGA